METHLVLTAAMILVGCGSLGLIIVRLSNPFLKGLGWLAACFVSGSVGTQLLLLNGRIPDLYTKVLANWLVLLGYLLLQASILELTDSEVRFTRLGLTIFILEPINSCIFTYVHPSHQLRVVIGSLLFSTQVLQSAFMLIRRAEKGLRVPARFTAIVLFGVAAFDLYRGVSVARHGIPQDILSPSLLQLIGVMIFLAASMGIGFGFFWISTAKLRITLERLASTDPLTGVCNSRVFREMCQKEMARSLRSSETFSLLVIDLDHFKRVNDRYGHLTGDAVLCAVAQLLQRQLRTSDTLGRWGGEEFVILLPSCAIDTANDIAERLRRSIAELPLNSTQTDITGCGSDFQITASLGTATYRGGHDSLDDLFRRSDQALYRAKDAGRNRALSVM